MPLGKIKTTKKTENYFKHTNSIFTYMMEKKTIFIVFVALLGGCSLGQTYLKDEFLDADRTTKIVVLPLPSKVRYQQVGTGHVVVFGLIGELVALGIDSSRVKEIESSAETLSTVIEDPIYQNILRTAFRNSLKKIAWVGAQDIIFLEEEAQFEELKLQVSQKTHTLVKINPEITISPALNFIEFRSKIRFFNIKGGDLSREKYNITAVAQSEPYKIAGFEEKKYYKKENIQKALQYLAKEEGSFLTNEISRIIAQGGNVTAAAIVDASNSNAEDREFIQITFKYFPDRTHKDKMKGYRLKSFSTESIEIIRPNPDPMNAPIGAPNVIYSVSSKFPIESIWNRE